MPPTIISPKASNWVDRGESANPTIVRVLGRYLNRNPSEHRDWLDEHATIILGMVAADATEVHLVGYLRSITRDDASLEPNPPSIRITAIALWHIAKSALVRDFAERVLRGEVPVNEPTPDSFSHWIATRLLTAEELARFEEDADNDDSGR